MKKRMLLSLCAAVLSALLLLAAFPAAALAVETIVLTAGEPYITAIAGETVDLTRYAVTLNGANIIDRVSDDSAFFKLQPGENDIIVEGGTTADVKILWKDRWL